MKVVIRERLPDNAIGHKLDSHTTKVLYFNIDNLVGQSEFGYTVF